MLNRDQVLRWMLTGLLVVCGAGVALASDGEKQPTPSVTLSNEDIDLGIEALEAKGVLPGAAHDETLALSLEKGGTVSDADTSKKAEVSAAPKSETEAPKKGASAEGARAAEPESLRAAPAPVSAGPLPATTGLSFEACMERSIRAGNGYDESARVCRSVTAPPPSEPAW